MTVLEYGAGGSTTLFSRFTKKWVSIDHDEWWGQKVNKILLERGLESKAKVYTVPTDLPYKNGDGTEEQFQSYINFPKKFEEKYDLIIDDGRARVPVSIAALKNNLFQSSSSLLIIHDWQRRKYKPIVNTVGYRVWKKDTVSKRHREKHNLSKNSRSMVLLIYLQRN